MLWSHQTGGKVRERGKNITIGSRGRASSSDEIYPHYTMNRKKTYSILRLQKQQRQKVVVVR